MATPKLPGGNKYNEYLAESRARIRNVELRLRALRQELELKNHQLEQFIAIGEDLRLLRDALYKIDKIGQYAAQERLRKGQANGEETDEDPPDQAEEQ